MYHTHSVILSAAKDLMATANGVLVEASRDPSLRSGRQEVLFNTRKLTHLDAVGRLKQASEAAPQTNKPCRI